MKILAQRPTHISAVATILLLIKTLEDSEDFIVEGHLTRYKWYDYKHAHTTYAKQLTNNTKQTQYKKKQKKETNTNKKKRKEKKQRRHASDTYKSKYCHIWLNTH